jgi:hypothetical protein
MRISEKSIELNVPKELAAILGPSFWFGLTQEQEARSGYDAWVRTKGGLLMILQYKVYSRRLKRPPRAGVASFSLDHKQMTDLAKQTRGDRSVFYVLPSIGETGELVKAGSLLLPSTYALDVTLIPSGLAPPSKTDGTSRRSGLHHLDLYDTASPPVAVLHSEPTELPITSLRDVVAAARRDPPDVDWLRNNFWAVQHALGPAATGVVFGF